MNVSKQLAGFFIIALHDRRLTTSHVSIYAALCAFCAESGVHPFAISRRQIMQACKILGNATYHKCMRELTAFGYIQYVPSYHSVLGSLVTLNEFSVLLNK